MDDGTDDATVDEATNEARQLPDELAAEPEAVNPRFFFEDARCYDCGGFVTRSIGESGGRCFDCGGDEMRQAVLRCADCC